VSNYVNIARQGSLCGSAVYGEDLLLAAAVQYKPDLKRLG